MGEQIAVSILNLLAGIGVFLLAVRLLSRNIEAISGNKLKNLFSKTSKSKLLGVGLGTFTAAVIQSSGAVTVMVIGFINAGLMDLTQGSVIAFGANIGTTITGQIVALGMFGENAITTTIVFMALTGIGAFIVLFAKKDLLQKIGSIIAGFGLLFVGLEIMSSSMSSFAEMESLKQFIASVKNPFLLILIGTAVTALLQSSSVMTSILITMVFSGLITLDQGIYMVMGSNIGAGVVAILAAMGGSADAKRLSLIHLAFNVFGAILFSVIGVIVSASTGGTFTIGTIFEKAFPNAPQTQLAMFHTAYNVLKVAIFLPLTKPVVGLFEKLIREKKKEEADAPHMAYIEEHFLKTPPIAVEMVRKEIQRMFKIALGNFDRAVGIVCSLDFSEGEAFKKDENVLNYLNKYITKFIVKIPSDQIDRRDAKYLSTAYKTVSDLERVGDYAENIVEYAASLSEIGANFSAEAVAEIRYAKEKIDALAEAVYELYETGNEGKKKLALEIEDEIDDFTKKMADNHVERMEKGTCQPDVGALYLELASNSERIADHFVNVAKTVKIH